jgi:biotin carboxylase
MKNVLFIAPTAREHRALPALAEKLGIRLIWDDFAGDYFDDFLEHGAEQRNTLDIVDLIERTISKYRDADLSGVTSAVGYPGMSVVAVMSERLGLPGPKPEVIMQCEHKYYSRLAQQNFVPDATPWFAMIDPAEPSTFEKIKSFPAFLKPVKSCMSMNAFRLKSREEFLEKVKSASMPERFTKPFDDMAEKYTNFQLSCDYLLVEDLLKGRQVSLEGYVADGEPVVMGIIDGEMVPGTLSFNRWLYPSRLPDHVQQRMERTAKDFFKGIGYDNAMFNMELMWDEEKDRVSIIEVNPKIASQFPDLFEKVDGVSSYQYLLQLAVGEKPVFKPRQGKFKLSASCVLRKFEDQKVVRKPKDEDLQKVREKFPDALVSVIATEGNKLSEQTQDTDSFRYGLINIGANSLDELEEKRATIEKMLPFEFVPVHAKC